MQSTRILLLCIAAAVLYGEIHDQITARVCIEYFTIAHPHVMDSTSPTRQALFWGFAATWWVGALLGIPLMIACQAGRWPRIAAKELVRPIGLLMLCMAAFAGVSGTTGYLLVARGVAGIGEWGEVLPPEIHARFNANAFTHLASYISGFLGGMVLIGWSIWKRRRMGRPMDS